MRGGMHLVLLRVVVRDMVNGGGDGDRRVWLDGGVNMLAGNIVVY